jgi:hypothetical protein
MKRPTVTKRRIGRGHTEGEHVLEVTFPDGLGALISIRVNERGARTIEVYRCDYGINVIKPMTYERIEDTEKRVCGACARIGTNDLGGPRAHSPGCKNG